MITPAHGLCDEHNGLAFNMSCMQQSHQMFLVSEEVCHQKAKFDVQMSPWKGNSPPPAENNFCRARRFRDESPKAHVHLSQGAGVSHPRMGASGPPSSPLWAMTNGPSHYAGFHASALPLLQQLAGHSLPSLGSELCGWRSQSILVTRGKGDKRQLWLFSV